MREQAKSSTQGSQRRSTRRTLSETRGQGLTQRAEAKVAGWAYLLYIVVAMSSMMLFARASAGRDVAEKLSTLNRMMGLARFTVLIDLLGPVCALVLAVTLYRLVKAVDPTFALLAMVFRVGEGLLAAFPILDKLELMQLARAPAAGVGRTVNDLWLGSELLHRPDNGFGEFCFVVGGFLFASLFLRGRLIPQWLAWIGVITIGVQAIFVPLQIASMVPGSMVNWLWFPILLYEVPLGVWLIVKGTGSRSGG